MTLQTFRLVPRLGTGFHFGRQGEGIEESSEMFPSDSLFAALVAVYADVYGDPADFLAGWEQFAPPFLVSSVFPYAGDVALFPLPRLRPNLGSDGDPGTRKKLKKLRYVSGRILRRLLAGADMSAAWAEEGARVALQDGAIWLDSADVPSLPETLRKLDPLALRDQQVWKTDAIPRVTIDRGTSSSTIYQVGRTVFADGCGVWFLADVFESGDGLAALVEELGVRGMGGERNAGYGAFTIDPTPLPLPELPTAASTQRVMTLARYVPRPAELDAGVLGDGASYELVKVGGWLASAGSRAQRRRTIHMIEAGSVLVNTGKALMGQLVDVRPEYETATFHHPVYRSGFALTIGVG